MSGSSFVTKFSLKSRMAWKWLAVVCCIWCVPLCCCVDEVDEMAFAAPGQPGQTPQFGTAQITDRRYLLFDVNMGEGFNLRRDVYMRAAQLLKELHKVDPKWVLVLPPYRHLYHWQSRQLEQDRVPWSKFFNVDELGKYVPVMEFDHYLAETHGNSIDQVWYLQGYEGGWKEGEWEEKIDFAKCLQDRGREYYREQSGVWHGPFFGYYETIHAKEFRCVSVQGTSLILKDKLLALEAKSIMIDRFEAVLHPLFGEQEYWLSRKSMVYADHLKAEAEDFMAKHLPKKEDSDKKKGLPYLAVHLRRGDFARSYKGRKGVPSNMKGAAKQINEALKRTGLKVVYVASDASDKELAELKKLVPSMEHYKPSKSQLNELLDGGVAIVEQWICANARHFIGTDPSTYTFRINEDRELLRMPHDSTYNGFCSDGYRDHQDEEHCAHPTRWTMPAGLL